MNLAPGNSGWSPRMRVKMVKMALELQSAVRRLRRKSPDHVVFPLLLLALLLFGGVWRRRRGIVRRVETAVSIAAVAAAAATCDRQEEGRKWPFRRVLPLGAMPAANPGAPRDRKSVAKL